ncbi:YkgJ family cysteine cluster protein [Solidesulfovibrio fructosivorans]|nr:YkgJ family cysteine cluster protein [Solidesulfovibrio fructosivorans]
MPQVVAFTCRRCGHCCQGVGGIMLSLSDITRLAEHLGLTPEAMLARFAEHVGGKDRLATGADGYCIFYNEGCSVHPARPDVCRAWPYFRGNIIDAASHAMAAEDCPGINTEVDHAEFARQGMEYLRRHGLARVQGVGAPEALAVMPPQPAEETEHGPCGCDAS